jgi:sigma-B regulation protein RsbU (phosphoserine phosphatase)
MRVLRVGDTPADRKTWTETLQGVTLAAGEVLFRQGDPADALFFIEEGELAVMLEVPGAGRAPVRRFGAGQCLGEMALYRSERRAATVESLTDSRLRKLTATELSALEVNNPALAMTMHRHVASLLAERIVYSNLELKDPLARLAHALRGLAASDFANSGWDGAVVTAAARRVDEVGSIAQAMEYLVKRLHKHIEELQRATAAREAIESELRIAGEIQASLLPPPLTEDELANMDFAATIKPARETGGDLFDGFQLRDGRFFMLVGDVSGKGVPAAVFMALTAMGVRTLARDVVEPGDLLTQVNRLLCERNNTMQFVTAFAAILDPLTGELTWANAGHPSPALLDAKGRVTWLEGPRAVPLAAVEHATYQTQSTTLAHGTTLIVYSDGVTEAMDAKKTLFGNERLATCFSDAPMGTARDVVARLISAVKQHEAGATQTDDITVIALRRA